MTVEAITVSERVTEYTLNAVPERLCPDQYAWEVKVAYRGDDRWAVTHLSWCLNTGGNWDYERIPSERSEEWKAMHRFSVDEALRLAREVAPTIEVNGWSPAAIIEKYRGQEGTGSE